MVIKPTERVLKPSTGIVDMLISMGNKEPQPQNLTPAQEYISYEYVAANGSMKLHRTPATWNDARLKCYDEGAELASPETEALVTTMSRILRTSKPPILQVFTGVNDLFSKGYFTSLKGIPLKKMPPIWIPRDPSNVNQFGNCLAMQRSGRGRTLLDSRCEEKLPFICYKRDPPSQFKLCGTMDTEYIYDKLTKTCHKIHKQLVSWHVAYATCVAEGSYLAIINSGHEAVTLARRFKSFSKTAHVGFSYWRKDLWMTIHGESIEEAGYASWASGEPSDDGSEEPCGDLASDGEGLVGAHCAHKNPFICERDGSM
ncbi:macrophage mannose receptor 1-like isoform X2 [Leguminivora glycinivorella]|uniref:macrophage mannose receptor 1-like isoform X2 n=1 Tax=Leguminivora glycinivorella TaxID=1035111 RepID=UPI00200E1B4E|nr:macrophage mannose receptor 1-like isoform X2 [Leguminivora glycinivorella]